MLFLWFPSLKVPFTPPDRRSTVSIPLSELIRAGGVLTVGDEGVPKVQLPASRIVGMNAREYGRRSITGNEEVRVEIRTFLQALASYADRVARDPGVTFEEHHVSLMAPAGPTSPTPARRNLRCR